MLRYIKASIGVSIRALVALIGIAGLTAVLAGYSVTQGTGTTFGSIVVGSTHYAQQFICDPTTPTQCAQVNSSGQLSVIALVANTNTNGQKTMSGSSPVVLPSDQTAIPVTLSASAAGAATLTSIVAAASNNSTLLKAGAGSVYGIQTGSIAGSTPAYLKLYDKATAPTCGTDVPVSVFIIPPTNSGNNGTFPVGKAFSLGIGFCIVSGIAANDNSAVPAATIITNLDYK